MTGDLYINGKDAYTSWGVFLDDGALSVLMTPPPMKAFLENSTPGGNGKQVLATNPHVDERSFTIAVNLHASTEHDFFTRYQGFVSELQTGVVNIRTKYQPTVTYKCIYVSCQQFAQFRQGIGKFTLRLTEPNPADRTL